MSANGTTDQKDFLRLVGSAQDFLKLCDMRCQSWIKERYRGPLWVVHGRPRFAKHSFHDQQKVKIAPVHPDFGAAITATVPDGIC